MPATGRYYDLDQGEALTQAVIRHNGDEIAFDLKHQDGYTYSVLLKRNNGSLFTGRAVSHPGNDVADVTCRVLVDLEEKLYVISGTRWEQPGQGNFRWYVVIEAE